MNLKEIRLNRGLTQTEVAKKLGIAQVTYCNYENGNRNPDVCTLMKLSDVFNVSIDELFGYQGKKQEEKPISRQKRYIIDNLDSLTKEELNKVMKYIDSCLKLKQEKSL